MIPNGGFPYRRRWMGAFSCMRNEFRMPWDDCAHYALDAPQAIPAGSTFSTTHLHHDDPHQAMPWPTMVPRDMPPRSFSELIA